MACNQLLKQTFGAGAFKNEDSSGMLRLFLSVRVDQWVLENADETIARGTEGNPVFVSPIRGREIRRRKYLCGKHLHMEFLCAETLEKGGLQVIPWRVVMNFSRRSEAVQYA